jgi:DNA-binding NtrC family response regulator
MDPETPNEPGGKPAASAANGDYSFVPAVSAAMRAIERTINDIAGADIPVLFLGETGTGKGAAAYRIHQLSRRQKEPFIKVNCPSLSAEFFKIGRASGLGQTAIWGASGTLFLDEIGELDPTCQPKLLYALPDGEPAPSAAYSGMRVIACSGRDLEQEVRAGRFREDLYYRISGVCLRIPALRHRKEDIPALLDFFLLKYSALFGRRKPEISTATLRAFTDYCWPGNVRELEYAVQKLVALGDERTVVADLRNGPTEPTSEGTEGLSLKQAARAASRQAERELILKVLARTRWNRKRAAQELSISYKALLYKLKQMGLDATSS